jgi:pimeloyl-ACP methyl ester carboxylesterase
VTGAGEPVTVFAHGFAGSIAETRPFGSGVLGSRVFFHFRGHGASADTTQPWTYQGLGAELDAVADAYQAARALGVSLGAGTVLANAVHDPRRFERLVLVLPAAIDEPREARALERVASMAQCADAGDVEGLAGLLLEAQPPDLRTSRVLQVWARQQAERLRGDRLRDAIRQVPLLHPLHDRSQLAAVECPVLLIGQRGDDAHPVSVVRDLAAALPRAVAEVFPPGGVPWTHRSALRELISGFLNTSGHANGDEGEKR